MKLDEIKKYIDRIVEDPEGIELTQNVNNYWKSLSMVAKEYAKILPAQALCKGLIYLATKIAYDCAPSHDIAFDDLYESLESARLTLEENKDV